MSFNYFDVNIVHSVLHIVAKVNFAGSEYYRSEGIIIEVGAS